MLGRSQITRRGVMKLQRYIVLVSAVALSLATAALSVSSSQAKGQGQYGKAGSRDEDQATAAGSLVPACREFSNARTAHGVSYVEAGQAMNGHQTGMAMEVFNAGTSELTALIMFVVDATQHRRQGSRQVTPDAQFSNKRLD